MKIHFKNVGQGDCIVIEWNDDNGKHYGIIDCNSVNDKNPAVEFLITEKVTQIEFLVISHFHSDHFSGMSGVFDHCVDNDITINFFYHTIQQFISEILDRVFTSQKVQSEVSKFFHSYEGVDHLVKEDIQASSHLGTHKLSESISMHFLAPRGTLFRKMAKQLSRKKNKVVTTQADVNKLATIIMLTNGEGAVLLTSDAVKKSFKNIILSIHKKVVLAQAPHHGSWPNIDEEFWDKVTSISNCPAIFSVGDDAHDKLPNVETVEFFVGKGYDVHSTNSVYGISEFFGSYAPIKSTPVTRILDMFSVLKKTTATPTSNIKLIGDHTFNVF